MRFRFFSLVLVLLSQAAFGDDVYATYRNARFGYTIAYPADILFPQGESDNGDGQRFLTKDADASLLVYGSNNVAGESLEDKYLEDSRGGTDDQPQKVVTYRASKGNWYVVSGYASGKVFYQKTILSDDRFKTLYFEYDESQKGIYDPIAGRISKSFKSLQ